MEEQRRKPKWKKWVIIAIVAAVLAVLLVPKRLTRDDGGTVDYKAIAYTLIKYDTFCVDTEDFGRELKKKGSTLYIFGKKVYEKIWFEDAMSSNATKATATIVPEFSLTIPYTPTMTPEPTDTVMPPQTPTNTPTATPTVSPKPTATPTVKPTATPANVPTPSPEPTATPTDTPTPTPSNTPTPAPVAWTEPKERKDIAEPLMAKVQAYRESNGVPKFKSPYVYYDVNAPGLGDRLNEKGLRVAKKCCMEHSANHEGFQIATGIYGYPWRVKEGWEAEDIAKQLFDAWYNSPAHNKNMLNDHFAQTQEVDVGVMHVVEYFDGEWWHYCAVMTISCVYYEYLPEGLE